MVLNWSYFSVSQTILICSDNCFGSTTHHGSRSVEFECFHLVPITLDLVIFTGLREPTLIVKAPTVGPGLHGALHRCWSTLLQCIKPQRFDEENDSRTLTVSVWVSRSYIKSPPSFSLFPAFDYFPLEYSQEVLESQVHLVWIIFGSRLEYVD